MTVPEMDICLNITTNVVNNTNDNKKKKNTSSQVNAKNSKREKLSKTNRSLQHSDGLINKPKTRIKQKSLAAIVAKQVGHNLNKKKVNFLIDKKNSIDVNSIKNNEKITSQSNVRKEKLDSQNIVQFVKNKNENEIKATVIRKKNVNLNSEKKSLSDVFSTNSEKVDSDNSSIFKFGNLSKNNNDDLQISASNFNENECFKNKKNFHEQKQLKFDFKRNKQQNDRQNKKFKGKDERIMHKPSGKISSLFGNNPEVPNIGQRYVKPVQENVFSGINFSDLDIHPYSVSNLEQNMQITKMTTVQQKGIPVILSGKDVLIRSQTGSGKTLTYSLPIIELLQKITPKITRNSGLKALVVVPTRELALQTYECFLKLVKPFMWIVPGYLVGGEKRKAEKARLRRGCNILVATPGRLLDHIKHTEALKLNDVSYFVLDEADRMLDMGYEKDISGIVSALKMSSSDPKETGYDPLKMLRENVIKKFSDDTEEAEEENVDLKNMDDKEEENVDVKRVYNSGSEMDSENEDYFVGKNRKTIKEKQSNLMSIDNREIVDDSPSDLNQSTRQTILLSATLTQAVEKLAGLTMKNPTFVDAAKENLELSGDNLSDINEDLIVPQSVVQSYIITPPKLRLVSLSAFIRGKCLSSGQHKILVFMATQDMIDYHTEILNLILSKPEDDDDEDSDPLVDVEFFKLHGSMSQKERTEVFKTFKKANSGVLFCTDVAARGLDLPKVDCVVQYTGPLSARDYVHRIGRTARAGSSGTATIFLTPPEIEFVRMLESRRIRIKQDDMNDVLAKLLGHLSKYRSQEAAAIALQNEFENLVHENKRLHEKACKAYISWIRFYASYPREMREIFDRKELHLGHYAKSFALRDPPQKISGIGKTIREKEGTKQQHNNRLANERPARMPQRKQTGGIGTKTGSLKKVRMLNTSEFDSGLPPTKKSRKS
ncbi:probable ATP-dependent RNA helicase CG8611 [Leptopilina heterotoma]|uniref:probable ATP-dependent RNA helicase CG8611 n=1 Tax=Leptopilina heterotoma TaxID=63436 RepID=UPI001CA990BC|nr:probable ATP-dependent RNA helicase CG8611 [Leptopilina heterotoma]